MSGAPSGALAPWQHQPFRWLASGRFVSMLGTAIAPVALAFAVLDLTGSATDLGLVLAARSVPLVVFVLVGGVVADRFPRHLVLLASNVVSAVSQGIAAALLLSGHATVGALVVLEVVGGSSAAFLWPALAGLTPQTVPASMLQQANALLRLATNGAMIGGSAVAGLLVAAFGSGVGLAADSVTYAVGALCLSRIRLAAGDRLPGHNVLLELREGWGEFRSRTWVWVIVVEFAFVNLAISGGFNTLGPVIADDTIGRTAWGFVLAGFTAGMVLGGLISLRMRPRRPLLVGCAATLLEVPLLYLLGLDPHTAPLVLLATVAGIGIETFGVYWDLSLQQHIPPERLSRVSSYDALGSFAFIPLGQVLAGPLAATIGVGHTVVAAASVVLVAAVIATATPAVHQVGRVEDRSAPELAEHLVMQ